MFAYQLSVISYIVTWSCRQFWVSHKIVILSYEYRRLFRKTFKNDCSFPKLLNREKLKNPIKRGLTPFPLSQIYNSNPRLRKISPSLLTWVPLCQTPASSPQMLRGSTSRQHPTEGTKTREFTPPIKQCKKNFHVVDNRRTATKVYQKVQFTCTLRVLCFNYKTLSDLTFRCCCRRI